MSNQRIGIIIQEINYWKEHKLLPDVYCNFLLALYTKGESELEITISKDERSTGIAFILQFTSQFILLLLSVTVINMQHINNLVQFGILLLSFLGILCLFRTFNRKRDIYFHLSTVILLVQLFLITAFLGNQYFTNQWAINIVIICNFICWFIIGRKYQLIYLQILSAAMSFIAVFYMFL